MAFQLGLVLLLMPWQAIAKFPDSFRMQGIERSDYADFEKKWQLVTVRYRSDTSEMRFVYGNDKAMRALKSQSKDFPDGAVFAKIGAMTRPDPAFTSSVVPSGSRRVQFMVRNKKLYKETGGWGYALFNANENRNVGSNSQEAMACYACHKIIAERGEVFSQLMNISNFENAALELNGPASASRIKFELRSVRELPEIAQKLLPKNQNEIQFIVGPMVEHTFSGTLDEVRPILAEQFGKNKIPAALLSKDGKLFSIVFQAEGAKVCDAKSGELSLRGVHSMADAPQGYMLVDFCQKF